MRESNMDIELKWTRTFCFGLIMLLYSYVANSQTTAYTETFTSQVGLSTTFSNDNSNRTFTTSLGTWSSGLAGEGFGGIGISTSAINGTTIKFKTGIATKLTTPTLRGLASISYTAKTATANATLNLTDGNASFTNALTVTTSNTLSVNININTTYPASNTSNGIFSFTYPLTASVTAEFIDDIIFTFNKPLTQASAPSVTFTGTGAKLDWTRPNSGNDNQGCIVFIGPSASTFVNPTNSTSYTDNLAFGSGTQIGSSGYYCVYNGAASTATITGLTLGTNYSVYVMEYNGVKGASDENYNISSPASLTFTHYTGVITTSPSSLSGFDATPSTTSPSQFFDVLGSALTGDILLTAPAGYEISLTSGSGYSNSLTLTQSAGSVPLTRIYVRLQTGLPFGIYTGNITLVAPNISQNVTVTGACYKYYYYKGTGALATLSNWGVNTDGTGAAPTDFGSVTTGQIFVLKNTTSVSTDAPWTIGNSSFTGNKLQIGDGNSPAITFTITAGNPLNISNKDKLYVLAASGGGSNELIFNSSVVPTLSAPDPLTNLTYANGATGVNVSGSLCNTLKIANNTSVTLNNTPNCKYLIVDFGSTIKAATSSFITLSAGGNAIVNGTIVGARSQGIFTTDPTSVTKGTIFSTDNAATLTLGCSSTVVYNRGSAQALSPVNYANLIISSGAATFPNFPTATTVSLSGTARIDGTLSFSGSPNGTFGIAGTGLLTFGASSAILISGGSINFNNRPVTLESSSIIITGITNTSGVTAVLASPLGVTICSGSATTLTVPNYNGAVQWQQSLNGTSGWVNIIGAITNSYTTSPITATTYYRASVGSACTIATFSNVVPISIVLKEWNGSWVTSAPTSSTDSILFSGGNYTGGSLTACSCTVTGGTVSFTGGQTLTLVDKLIVTGGTVLFDNESSLYQTNNVTNTVGSYSGGNSGTIIYKRVAQPMFKYDYTYWSSPVFNQNLQTLSVNSPADKFYQYNYTSQAWEYINPSNSMEVGRGYIIRAPYDFPIPPIFPASNFTAIFSGLPNNGTITYPITTGAGQFNLIGNPYPSVLDANDFINANTNINGTLYFWTHNTNINGSGQYSGADYASYNLTGGAATGLAGATGSGNSAAPSGIIASGQGFFVKGITGSPTGAAPYNVTFTNSMRRAGNNSVSNFFRNSQSLQTNNEIEKNRFWLNISKTDGGFKQALIGYIENATDGLDRLYDGDFLDIGNDITLYSISNNTKLTIQGRQLPFNSDDVVPLGYKSLTSGNCTISLDHFDGLFSSQQIYLEDKLLNLVQDIKLAPYTFDTAIGTFEDRFVIHYSTSFLGVNQSELKNIIVYNDNDKIRIKSTIENIKNIEIFDITGRRLLQLKNLDVNDFVLDKVIKNQIILINIELASGLKVIVKFFI